MSTQIPSSICTVDPYEFLQIVLNPDGTITRDPNRYPNTSPSLDSTPVLSQDININEANNTFVRVFLPLLSSPRTSKLPLIVYFHGGGFINCSAASTVFHDFCSKIAIDTLAVVVSVNYRLAPEHRLPAAYDDAAEVFNWIKNNPIDWLRENADYNNCFIMGSSAGANIDYNVGLRLSQRVDFLKPLKIRGLILHHPFVSGIKRMESEQRLVNDSHLPQSVSDLMWELALPIGVDRDHEYCNPTVDGGSRMWDQIRLLRWRVLITGCDGDPMIDRQRKMVDILVGKGVEVAADFSEGGYHVVELKDANKASTLLMAVRNFVYV